MNALLVDIDHTISDAFWRDDLMQAREWDAYHVRASADQPITGMVSLVRALKRDDWFIICITARPEKWRDVTASWLENHGITFDQLLMRDSDDLRSSHEIKRSLYTEHVRKYYWPILALDDCPQICEMWRDLGITSLQVRAVT